MVVKDLLESSKGDFAVSERVLRYFKIFHKENNHKAGLSTLNTLKNKELKGQEEPFMITSLAINGRDLINKGYTGEAIGIKLRELLQYVKLNPEYNKKPTLVQMI